MDGKNPWNERYTAEGYFWDKVPLPICQKLIEIAAYSASYRPKLIDLGCGEGRNVVFFAQHGFDATGVDISSAGLQKTVKYAAEVGVHVETVRADLSQYRLQDSYDVVFSTMALHYLASDVRAKCFEDYKEHTLSSGINLISVPVEKPYLPREPDDDSVRKFYRSGQLAGYYWDWELLYCSEEIKE